MKLLVVVILALGLAGCSEKPSLQAYAEDQLYEGYPCGDTCDAFGQGYEKAATAGYTSHTQCGSGADPSTVGCKVYVTEFDIEQREYDELMRDIDAQLDAR